MICDNLSVNEKGHLAFAGYDTVDLAKKYGTPLYLMDENKIREHVRAYKKSMAENLPEGSLPEYASKAFSCKRIYEIMAEEDIDIDVVSVGEIYTAFSAGYPMSRAFFHGNIKTDADIRFAIEKGVGYIVIDSLDEIFALNEIAKEMGVKQKVLVRVSPGIDPHTHKKISTGSLDCKFGLGIEDGQAKKAAQAVLNSSNIELCGFHCHVGSQIFESETFALAAEMMLEFTVDIKESFGYLADILNLGGGFGVRYTESDPSIDVTQKIAELANSLKELSAKMQIALPKIHLEPGRSLVADAGITLYTVGAVKEIKGHKNYVSIDGGMTDNPRFALYEAVHSVILASRANEENNYLATVAGRCCESGDLIGEDYLMPKPQRNDILAVLTTGAYNYSMASNYNRVSRPPVVMLSDKGDYLAVKRETLEDITRLDV